MDILGLTGVAELTCNQCANTLLIDASDLAIEEVGADERNMGPEVFFHGAVELVCTKCGYDIEIECEASEYPVGVLNDSELNVSGAKLSKGFPEPEIVFDEKLYLLGDQAGVYLPSDKRIFTGLTLGVSDLMATISAWPELLYQIDPRKFEEIIAEVFDKHDFQVELTPRTRDGGRDIVAIRSTLGVKSKYIIECKRYAKTNPVSVGLVRSLYGVQTQEGANKSILATTSHFTSGAKNFASSANSTQWGMDLKDYDDIVEWIRQTHKKGQ